MSQSKIKEDANHKKDTSEIILELKRIHNTFFGGRRIRFCAKETYYFLNTTIIFSPFGTVANKAYFVLTIVTAGSATTSLMVKIAIEAK